MPVEFIDDDDLPIARRESKIVRTEEWKSLSEKMAKPFPKGKSLRITLSPKTIGEFADKKAAVVSFGQRLRKQYRNDFAIKIVGDQILVMNKDK